MLSRPVMFSGCGCSPGVAALSFIDSDREWKYKELLAIDRVLETLQDRVGNTKLLKLAGGGDLSFERTNVVQGDDHYFGENDSQGTIRLADSLF